MIPLDDEDPAVVARKLYEQEHGSGSVKTKRLTSEQLRQRHAKVEESASAELGRLLRATLPFLHMGDEALVGELVFHPPVALEWKACPQCACAAPSVITKPMRATGAWSRNWRFDWAFPGQRLGIEVQGQGRHQTYVGYRGDCEKLNSSVLHGWRVLWFVAAERKQMQSWVTQVVAALGGQPPAAA